MRRPWLAALCLLAAAVCAVWVATEFVAAPWVVAGASMEPSYRTGDRVLVDVWTYRIRSPRPGEVLLVEGPGGAAMIKRVARTPGNGEGIWVVGDNPERSLDSRSFGAIDRARVRGRVIRRLAGPYR